MPTAPVSSAARSRGERRVTYALKVVLLVAVAAIMLSWFLDFVGRISSVAIIVIGATFFTYLIYPAVRRLNTRMPMALSILVVYAVIAGVAGLLIATVVPPLYEEAQTLVRTSPTLVHSAQRFLTDPNNPLLARLPASMRAYLASVPPQLARFAQQYAGDAAAQAVTIALSVVGIVATVIIIPVMSVYMMFEAPEIIAALLRVVPASNRPAAIALLHDLDAVLGGFIRGQLLVGATIGTCITVALLILHVKYALLIGVAAGLLDVIPYVGAIVGFVPAVTLAFLNDGWQHALIVALVFAGIFQAEGHFVAPRIVSESVGLTPLTVIVAILIGGTLLGLGGMFLAVPIAAALRVIIMHAVPAARRPIPEKTAEAITNPPPAPPAAKPKARRARA